MGGAGKSHGKGPATGRDENYGLFCYQYTNVTKLKEQEIRILESKRYKSEISCEVLGKRHNLPKTPFPCFLTYKIGGEITPNSHGSSNDYTRKFLGIWRLDIFIIGTQQTSAL